MYWPFGNYWSMNLACSPYLCWRACPTQRILQDHQSIPFLESEIEPPCQRLNRHGLRMKTLSCIIYVFIYVHELVNLEVPWTNSKSTSIRCRRWFLLCVSKVKVCRPKAGMHILIFNLSLLSTEDGKAESRCTKREMCSIIPIWCMFFTTPEELWSQSVSFQSERMLLIWVSFTSEYLQFWVRLLWMLVDVAHQSANEIRCPSQQVLFYSDFDNSIAMQNCRPLFSSKVCCSF